MSLKQDIQLDSACGTPQYTNFTEGFADCLDYIFYEKNKLKVEQVCKKIISVYGNTKLGNGMWKLRNK